MRLGYAVQLGTVRFLGTFLDDPADVPPGVSGDIARQLGIADPRCLTLYRKGRAKWQHAREIRAGFGYREFTDGGARFRLARWLYALCWTGTDRPSVLFDRATAWLVTEKVLSARRVRRWNGSSRVSAHVPRSRLWRTPRPQHHPRAARPARCSPDLRRWPAERARPAAGRAIFAQWGRAVSRRRTPRRGALADRRPARDVACTTRARGRACAVRDCGQGASRRAHAGGAPHGDATRLRPYPGGDRAGRRAGPARHRRDEAVLRRGGGRQEDDGSAPSATWTRRPSSCGTPAPC